MRFSEHINGQSPEKGQQGGYFESMCPKRFRLHRRLALIRQPACLAIPRVALKPPLSHENMEGIPCAWSEAFVPLDSRVPRLAARICWTRIIMNFAWHRAQTIPVMNESKRSVGAGRLHQGHRTGLACSARAYDSLRRMDDLAQDMRVFVRFPSAFSIACWISSDTAAPLSLSALACASAPR